MPAEHSASPKTRTNSRIIRKGGGAELDTLLQGLAKPLIPSVYRDDSRGPNYESAMANRFAQRAPTRHANCPMKGDLAAWLFLMQHYRLPTRLLDWTEGPLIALFFAVEGEEDAEKDGVLWALKPFAMNGVLNGDEGVFQPGHPVAKRLIELGYSNVPANEDRVAALVTEEIDLRMMVQLSGLTIHGSAKALEDYDRATQFLRSYVIPADAKPGLLVALKLLGIRNRNLFPDLERLAEDLKEDHYPD